MRKLLIPCLLLLSCFASAQELAIMPKPVSVQPGHGQFTLSPKTVIAAGDEENRKAAAFLNDYLQQVYGFRLDVDRQESKGYIRLVTRRFIQAPEKDAYTLQVTGDGITIEGDTYPGTFYGIQTLISMLPLPATEGKNLRIPFAVIQDAPRFAYRGMHLDVCRHFFPVSFIKKYIDILALHKMNYFHWHLTDDQGWRIQIKKYPELTAIGGVRHGTIIGRYPGSGNDNARYGGSYTQEEIKDIVAYAASRYITVIPEIEMPGHASAAIATFPWLSCFPGKPTEIPTHPSIRSKEEQAAGRPKQVQETWGVFEDVFCAGNDSTFAFLQNVLDEVIPLFPSPYIHIGGDESPKSHWKKCPRCQARIKAEGLKDEHELQSYFIQRIEKYVNSKGRTIIGWDEILEGGLAPNAVVMSWRGTKGGLEAARQKHKVIMTPEKPVYFDHAQSRIEDSLVRGGYNPLEQVYAYEPVPADLSPDLVPYILGAQANMWAEYASNPDKVTYMVLPRMSALSEVLWSPAGHRNWKDFEKRLPQQLARYAALGIHYSRAFYDLKAGLMPSTSGNGVLWKLEPSQPGGTVTVTHGNKKTAYTKPFAITKNGQYTATYTRDGQVLSNITKTFSLNKATGKKITVAAPANGSYAGQDGPFSLINGLHARKGLSDPDWMGWIGQDLVATIDLGKSQKISRVQFHTLDQKGSWIYPPQQVEVFLSTDGRNFRSAGLSSVLVPDTLTMAWVHIAFTPKNARYVRVVARNHGLIAEGNPGAGNKSWVFCDEIRID